MIQPGDMFILLLSMTVTYKIINVCCAVFISINVCKLLKMHSLVIVGILLSYPQQEAIKITISLGVTFCSLVDLLNCTATRLHYHNLNIFCFIWPYRGSASYTDDPDIVIKLYQWSRGEH
jgi:hypothetical protein